MMLERSQWDKQDKHVYTRNPFNYTGAKYKILDQVYKAFPDNVNKLYDVFCGSGEVSLNSGIKKLILNDSGIITKILSELQEYKITPFVTMVFDIINNNKLNKENEENYYSFRSFINSDKFRNSLIYSEHKGLFYFALLCHSFNNMIRFNRSGLFNVPFGKRTFNAKQQVALEKYSLLQTGKKITYEDRDFRDFLVLIQDEITEKDLLFIDPPYLISDAAYCGTWKEQDERDLYSHLDYFSSQGIRFCLTNLLESKGKTNEILKAWSEKYKVIDIDNSFKGCNHQRTKGFEDREVIVTNY